MPVKLPAAERASYMELNQQLMSQDMRLMRGGGTRMDNDRAKRLREILGSSKSPEEALLKRCSLFTLGELGKNRKNASQDCDLIVKARTNQYSGTIKELELNLKHATWLQRACEKEHEHFKKWKHGVSTNLGDHDTKVVLMNIIQSAEKGYSNEHEDIFYRQPPTVRELQAKTETKEVAKVKAAKDGKTAKAKKAKKAPRPRKASSRKSSRKSPAVQAGSDDDSDNSNGAPASASNIEPKDTRPIRLLEEKEKVQALRDLTGHLRALSTELVARIRALRFFKVVRAVQFWQCKPLNKNPRKKLKSPAVRVGPLAPECSKCKTVVHDPKAIAIFGLCGHTACASCLAAPERGGECVIVGCHAPVHSYHVHKAIELGEEDQHARVDRHDGQKMEDVMDLIKTKIAEHDQVLLFVQFNDLMEKVSAALDYHGIKHWALTENARRYAPNWMADFQTNVKADKKKVLVLNLADESAAGA